MLQAGVPANEEQYIHRLGRTARAGAQGQGILLLCPFERFFLDKAAISALPLQPYQAQPQHSVDPNVIRRALSQVSEEAKGQAYGAWLGYMKGFGKSTKWSPPQLISMANTFAFDTCQYVGNGDGKAPPMEAKTIGKMGLKDFVSLLLMSVYTLIVRTEKFIQCRFCFTWARRRAERWTEPKRWSDCWSRWR